MQVDFNDEQAELLRILLDTALRDLSHEIADTDLPAYRRMLRDRQSQLNELLEMFGGPMSDAERFGT